MSTNAAATSNSAKEKLVTDFKIVVADTEELIKATASQAGEKITVARERVQESLREAKKQMDKAEDAIIEKTKHAAKATDTYVHDNPWKAVGIAAGVGLIVGLLISRR